MYLDAHYVYVAAGEVAFNEAEVGQAMDEMKASGEPISSIERLGIAIGLTQNKNGTQYVSAYAGGIWLNVLATDVEGKSGRYWIESVSTGFLLDALGTDYEEEARTLSGRLSAQYLSRQEAEETLLDIQLDDLRRRLRDTKKFSVHLTESTLATVSAAGAPSGRLNAIVARYRAMLDNPQLAPEIAQIEALERRQYAKRQANNDGGAAKGPRP